ncbi:Alpha/Beta hydrolase protein [Lophiotrema nucula]|uniref:Alpha/Beta hydrolase protein n=1 Tax=Lophiotrema nucula TaxID=690887 RepID=A0A6A5ZI07_9PLEO|nr:Alpha/Beta hydrolase protein [Lophiotrema nucula]
MSDIRPFTLSVPQSALDRLQEKLELTVFPDELEDAQWDYGAPLGDVKRLVEHWRTKYDFRRHEAEINKLPNFETTIEVDGFHPIDVHFVHQKSSNPNAIPLIFVHGWPGHFLEAKKILPLLAESEKNGGPAFHVVAPSLPNFGFSGAVKKKGFGMKQYAETCHRLMLKLGYEEYVSQGGDWGTFITRAMAMLYPDSLKATHINMVACPPPGITQPIGLLTLAFKYVTGTFSAQEKAGFERTQWFQKQGSGYYHVQTTKPQTLGYSLADSPVAVLAWIYEKLHDWTDSYPWTDDEVLDWISVYWFSRSGPAASVRIYYESLKGEIASEKTYTSYIPVKLGLGYFPRELALLPKSWATRLGPIVFSSDHKSGGHFAAWENPEGIAEDMRVMFGKGGGAYAVVSGKDGY